LSFVSPRWKIVPNEQFKICIRVKTNPVQRISRGFVTIYDQIKTLHMLSQNSTSGQNLNEITGLSVGIAPTFGIKIRKL
jgi:hypothetical protein